MNYGSYLQGVSITIRKDIFINMKHVTSTKDGFIYKVDDNDQSYIHEDKIKERIDDRTIIEKVQFNKHLLFSCSFL